jgi:hypothetical protein
MELYICQAQVLLPGPWVIGGDFNTVLENWERKGGVGNARSMRNFRMFMDLANVIDIPMMGMRFTWFNNRENESWARLDRFLCDPLFLSWFPKLVQKGLYRNLSDHNLVCIGEPDVDWGPRPFRCLNSWLEDKSLLEGVQNKWTQTKGFGTTGLRLFCKTRAVKQHMKSWMNGRKTLGDQIKVLEAELEAVEVRAVSQGWTLNLRQERSACLAKLWKQIRVDEQKWKQISRVKWLKEGDRNTRFFHILANTRRKTNFIGEIEIEGRLCAGPDQVKEGVHKFFKEHF